jgi:Oxidoreductase molybdopterin binding domain
MRHRLTILAYEMNGKPLSVLHGAPLQPAIFVTQDPSVGLYDQADAMAGPSGEKICRACEWKLA